MPFPILEVSPDSVTGDEQLGSKNKFWFLHEKQRWLFKERRPETGEDWAEKLASEFARILTIPAAQVELAVSGDRFGCASKLFVADDENLMHGNEILAGQITGYDRNQRHHHSDHTLANIVKAIELLVPSQEIYDDVLSVLGSYFVLDALIGNTDRHHENWGFLMRFTEMEDGVFDVHLKVAPSFDHASSLGRELQDERRTRILDENRIGRYARGGHGGIYLQSTDPRGANPLGLIEYGMQHHPQYFTPALQRLAGVPVGQLTAYVDEVPAERISDVAKVFAKQLLTHTHTTLTGLLA